MPEKRPLTAKGGFTQRLQDDDAFSFSTDFDHLKCIEALRHSKREDGPSCSVAPRVNRRALLATLLLTPLLGVASLLAPGTAASMPMLRQKGRVTGYPLPRFASLKADRVRMRAGPSTDYPVRFIYEARGLPVEIIEEYDNWRQVRDSDGTSGWMSAVMLSGARTGLVAPGAARKAISSCCVPARLSRLPSPPNSSHGYG